MQTNTYKQIRSAKEEHLGMISTKIKALTALVGRLSLSVGWENRPERGCKTVFFFFFFFFFFVFFFKSAASDLGLPSRKHAYIILTPLNPTFI